MLKHGSASFGGPVRSKNSIYAYVLFHHLPCPLHSTYQPVGRARHAPPRHTNAGAQVELPGGPMSQDHGQSFQQWWRWTRWRRSSSPRTSMAILKPCLWEILNWWKLMETDGNWWMNWRYSIAQPRRSDLYLVKFQVPKTQHTQWSILAWKPMGPRVLHSRMYQGCIWTQLANAIGPSTWAGEHP